MPLPSLNGWGDIIGLPFSYGLSYLNAAQQNSYNRAQMNAQNAFNAQQAAINRQWQSQEAATARQWDAEQAQIAREWMSLPEQMKRAQEAGLNPLSVLGNLQSSPVAASSPMPSGSPAVSAGAAPAADPLSGMNLLGSFFQSLAQASKLSKETSRYDDITDAQIEQMWSDVNLKNEQAFTSYLENMITQAYGDKRQQLELKKLYAEAIKAAEEGETSAAQRWLYKANAKLLDSQNKQIELELPFIEERIKKQINLLLEQAKSEKAKQSASYAQADDSRASAQEHRSGASLKNSQKDAQVIANRLRNQTFQAEKDALVSKLNAELAKNMSDEAREKIRYIISSIRRDAYNDYEFVRNLGALLDEIGAPIAAIFAGLLK